MRTPGQNSQHVCLPSHSKWKKFVKPSETKHFHNNICFTQQNVCHFSVMLNNVFHLCINDGIDGDHRENLDFMQQCFLPENRIFDKEKLQK